MDAEPKKYERSGLRKDLKVKKVEETFDPFQSGGLNDEDASSTRPSFPRTSRIQEPQFELRAPVGKDIDLKRDYSRKNNVGLSHFSLCLTDFLTSCQLVQIKEEGSEGEKAPVKRTQKVKKVWNFVDFALKILTPMIG